MQQHIEAMKFEAEIRRRRTFAIISHPDAGKTTLTEKFLLYGGAVHLAGSVTARKSQRATTSDWMELERQRGISISSTVLQFDYSGCCINLLDTPGHKDFSEDTYRVLTAVDSVVMVIDAAKGIEPQTRKLFEVCRQRGVPIFTFMNKCDRPTRNPIELLDVTMACAWHTLCAAFDVNTKIPEMCVLLEDIELASPEHAAELVLSNMLLEITEMVGRFSSWYRMPARAYGLISMRDNTTKCVR